MPRVFIESDDGRARIEVRRDIDTDQAVGFCTEHHEQITERGHFEDTCEAVANHLANRHSVRSESVDTGILPNVHRCAGCSFTTASADRMDGHMQVTGHEHE